MFRYRIGLVLGVALAFCPAAATADILVDFSDKPLPAETFDNGSNGAGGFTSSGTYFNNSYDPTYGSWSGWSLSNRSDTTTFSYSNQYSAITGSGFGGSGTYAVADDFSPNASFINLPAGTAPVSMEVTNTTYAYLSMMGYDQLPGGYKFAKKYTTGDFFTLKITGFDAANATGNAVGEVDFDLARYTTPNDTPVHSWSLVNLLPISAARSLGFAIVTSDNGQFGNNQPAYFAMDNLQLSGTPVPEPGSALLFGAGLVVTMIAVRRRDRG